MDALLAASAPEAPQAPRDRSKPVANVERPVASFARTGVRGETPRRNVKTPSPTQVRTLFSLCNGPFAETLIAWSDDGERIVIADPPRFAEEICPKFFRHKNWTSFSRLLNMYEFHKIPAPPALTPLVEFKHPAFRRDGGRDIWKVGARSRPSRGATKRRAGGRPPKKAIVSRVLMPAVPWARGRAAAAAAVSQAAAPYPAAAGPPPGVACASATRTSGAATCPQARRPPVLRRRRAAAQGRASTTGGAAADLEAEVASLRSENALLRRTSAAAAEMILFSRDGVSRDGSGRKTRRREPDSATPPAPIPAAGAPAAGASGPALHARAR
ncbi:DNA binding protein [Aureococcus anophagefferens]|nr:DNA binding protein [Aureococcus anophagefferens]